MIDPKRIKIRYEKAKDRSKTWASYLQKCYELTMPNRANFTTKEQVPGQNKTTHLYDSTAAIGLEKYASNLQSLLFGVKNWARVMPGKLVKEGKTQINIDEADKAKPLAPLRQIKIIPYKEKEKWELCPKYNIGSK